MFQNSFGTSKIAFNSSFLSSLIMAWQLIVHFLPSHNDSGKAFLEFVVIYMFMCRLALQKFCFNRSLAFFHCEIILQNFNERLICGRTYNTKVGIQTQARNNSYIVWVHHIQGFFHSHITSRN